MRYKIIGLDSYQAGQVVYFLRKLADKGKTIIAVVHQPSQQIFSMFDDLLLISEGRQMYFGEVKNVRSHFEKLGYACDNDVGTAEHVLECISPNEGNGEEQSRLSKERIDLLADKATALSSTLALVDTTKLNQSSKKTKFSVGFGRIGPKVNIFRQFQLLFKRAFKESIRGKAKLIIQFVQQVSLGIIYGKETDKSSYPIFEYD